MTTLTKTTHNYATRRNLDLEISEYVGPEVDMIDIYISYAEEELLIISVEDNNFVLIRPCTLSRKIFDTLPSVMKNETELRVMLDLLATELKKEVLEQAEAEAKRIESEKHQVAFKEIEAEQQIEQLGHEIVLVDIWQDKISLQLKINLLAKYAISLKSLNKSEEPLFLIKLLEKKENLKFLDDYAELEQLAQKHPEALPAAIAHEKKNHPERYNEPSLCNGESTSNDAFNQEINQTDKKIDYKDCDNCINDSMCLHLVDFCVFIPIPEQEKEQGHCPIEHGSYHSIAGLDSSLSLPNMQLQHIAIEHIEIKADN